MQESNNDYSESAGGRERASSSGWVGKHFESIDMEVWNIAGVSGKCYGVTIENDKVTIKRVHVYPSAYLVLHAGLPISSLLTRMVLVDGEERLDLSKLALESVQFKPLYCPPFYLDDVILRA